MDILQYIFNIYKRIPQALPDSFVAKVVYIYFPIQTHSGMMSPHNPLHHPHHPHHVMPMSDADTDPRELEAFAERYEIFPLYFSLSLLLLLFYSIIT